MADLDIKKAMSSAGLNHREIMEQLRYDAVFIYLTKECEHFGIHAEGKTIKQIYDLLKERYSKRFRHLSWTEPNARPWVCHHKENFGSRPVKDATFRLLIKRMYFPYAGKTPNKKDNQI